MADYIPTTPPVGVEPAPVAFQPTAMTLRFAAMLPLFTGWIEAERDLNHIDRWDIAFTGWLRDAEQARRDFAEALDVLCGTEVERIEDRPLRTTARLIRALIESDTPDVFAQLCRLPSLCPEQFRCRGKGPGTVRVNLLIHEAFLRIDALATLPDCLDPIEAAYDATADHGEVPGPITASAA